MKSPSDRRSFLKRGTALTGLVAAGGARAEGERSGLPQTKFESDVMKALIPGNPPPYGVRSRFETTGRAPFEPSKPFTADRTPLQDLTGIITPNSLHFYVQHGSPIPEIDPQKHHLLIHGMVDRPTVLTMDNLKRLPFVSRIHFTQCAGQNYGFPYMRKPGGAKTVQETHGHTSCAEWTGVTISTLMREVGVKKGATWLIGEGAEWKKHVASIPLGRAMEDGIIAYAQNGEAIRPEQGYPLRMVLPGVEGMRNIKWLRRLYVTDRPVLNDWEISKYIQLRQDGKARWLSWDMEPNSVITYPSGEQTLPGTGYVHITGLAWTGTGSVGRVQVSTDGAKTWNDATLQQPVLPKAHTRFHFPWHWNGQETVIQSRCIDEWGNKQPTRKETEAMWGVGPDFFGTTNQLFPHFYASQPWRISKSGKVTNAMWE